MDRVMGFNMDSSFLAIEAAFCMLFIHRRLVFVVIYLSFCVFDNAIKDIIQSPYVREVHLLPEKKKTAQQHPHRATLPQRKLLRGPTLINLTHFLGDVEGPKEEGTSSPGKAFSDLPSAPLPLIRKRKWH